MSYSWYIQQAFACCIYQKYISGSGAFAWIRMIRIRFFFLDPDLDPVCPQRLDTGPDPDLVNIRPESEQKIKQTTHRKWQRNKFYLTLTAGVQKRKYHIEIFLT